MLEKMIGLLQEGTFVDLESGTECKLTVKDKKGETLPVSSVLLSARNVVVSAMMTEGAIKKDNIPFFDSFNHNRYFVSYEIISRV